MASRFDQSFGDSRTLLIQEHGVAGTYIVRGGATITTTVLAGAESADLVEMPGERTLYRHRTMEVVTADVALPGRGDTIQLDGEIDVWTVHERLPARGGLCGVRCLIPQRQPTEGRKAQG